MKTITIDAAKQSLGRLASQVAATLRGKNEPTFAPHRLPDVTVAVVNAAQAVLTGRKGMTKTYTSYSGYPGGLKQTNVRQLRERRGASELLRRAVKGMLPRNKLRDQLLQRLTISD